MSTAPAHAPPRDTVPPRPAEPGGAAPALPRPLTSFVGRAREVTAVRALLGRPDVQLVTLSGPGGVGKTRLAQRVVEDLAGLPDFADGIWFVALAPVRDPALVASTIVQALGVRPVADQPPEHALTDFLRDRQALLILDNFEHVLEAGPLVTALLMTCPSLKILVTSRAVLRVSGEHVFVVPPMALLDADHLLPIELLRESDAVRLFVVRAAASAADFALTLDNAPAVVEICRRLDGLPLAIELAAARMGAFTPETLRRRLEERLSLLAGGPRDQPPRLRSMRDAIAWSYDLLDPDEQHLFRRLAVFVGGWTLDAMEAIVGPRGDEGDEEPALLLSSVLDALASLIDRSLVQQALGLAGESRFTMLETIREFALAQLVASGEAEAVHRRHERFFLALAERATLANYRPDGLQLLACQEADHANLRAALAWLERQRDLDDLSRLVTALANFWSLEGHLHEGQAWLEHVLAQGRDWTSPRRAMELIWLGLIVWLQGDDARALDLLDESLTLTSGDGDSVARFHGFTVRGYVLLSLGDLAHSAAHQAEALAMLPSLGDEAWMSCAASNQLGNLGNVALARGDIAAAESYFTQALDRQRALGYAPGTSHVLASQPILGLADVARAQGDLTTALARYQEALRLSREFRHVKVTGDALGGVAATLAAAGRWEQAARLFGAAESFHAKTGIPFYLDRQRALGLPEPWRRADESCGCEQPLRDALADQPHAMLPALPDPPAAARRWSEGQSLSIDEAAAEAMAARLHDAPAVDDHAGLTPREREVLRLLVDGKTDQEIAAALFISRRTAGTHVRHIYDKLDVTSRAAATAFAVRHGLV